LSIQLLLDTMQVAVNTTLSGVDPQFANEDGETVRVTMLGADSVIFKVRGDTEELQVKEAEALPEPFYALNFSLR